MTVVPSSRGDKDEEAFHCSLSEQHLLSFQKKKKNPLPLAHKPIGSPLLITGRGESSLNIKHLHYCPLGIPWRQRISYLDNNMLSRTFFCVCLLEGCHNTQTICTARHRDVERGCTSRGIWWDQSASACTCICLFFDKVTRVDQWPLENNRGCWQTTTTRAFASVTFCSECSTARRDAIETDPRQKKVQRGCRPSRRV